MSLRKLALMSNLVISNDAPRAASPDLTLQANDRLGLLDLLTEFLEGLLHGLGNGSVLSDHVFQEPDGYEYFLLRTISAGCVGYRTPPSLCGVGERCYHSALTVRVRCCRIQAVAHVMHMVLLLTHLSLLGL